MTGRPAIAAVGRHRVEHHAGDDEERDENAGTRPARRAPEWRGQSGQDENGERKGEMHRDDMRQDRPVAEVAWMKQRDEGKTAEPFGRESAREHRPTCNADLHQPERSTDVLEVARVPHGGHQRGRCEEQQNRTAASMRDGREPDRRRGEGQSHDVDQAGHLHTCNHRQRAAERGHIGRCPGPVHRQRRRDGGGEERTQRQVAV